MPEPIENLYFNWLCAKVTHVEVPTPSLTHWKLLRKMYATEYVYILPNDKNRAEDGVELRDNFLREARVPDEAPWHDLPCSVLEMFIAFSYRAEFQFDQISANQWFWFILGNMGLADANDAAYDDIYVTDVLEKFIWRTYKFNGGGGGMFPILRPTEDQRHVEIWYQFSEYAAAIGLI